MRRGKIEWVVALLRAIRSYPKYSWTHQLMIAGIGAESGKKLRGLLEKKELVSWNGGHATLTKQGLDWLLQMNRLILPIKELVENES